MLAVTLGTLCISLMAGRLLAIRQDMSATTGMCAMIAGGASGITAMAGDVGADERIVGVIQYLRVLCVLLAIPLAMVMLDSSVAPTPAESGGRTTWEADVAFTGISLGLGLVVAKFDRLPASSLLGPLFIAAAVSVSGVLGTVAVPPPLEAAGYALIGTQVGLKLDRSSLRSIASLLPTAVLLISFLIISSAGMAAVLSKLTEIDYLSAYLATTPGGLYAVLASAADSGADITYVLAVQVVRLLVMLLAVPILTRMLRGGSDQVDAG